MKVKDRAGFLATDSVLAIVVILIFSGLVFGLMYNNVLSNTKVKKQAMAMLYLTQTLENVGIAQYGDITNTSEDIAKLMPDGLETSDYEITIEVEDRVDLFPEDETKEDIIKKVNATIKYSVGNKKYQYSIDRIKAKE